MRYAATAAADELVAPLTALAAWGDRHAADVREPVLRHDVCGSPLELRWHCPACDIDVAAPGGGDAGAGDPGVFVI
jgi:hypothetical protein